MKKYARALLATALLVLPIAAEAHQINFLWTAPNRYNDGTTVLLLADITDFKIYQTDVPVPGQIGQLIATIPTPTSANVTYTFNSTTITPGLHTFVVVTDTRNGSVSEPSTCCP